MFVEFNPNPRKKTVDDCIIRAISIFTGKSWGQIYTELCAEGLEECDWPNMNYIWMKYLERLGLRQHLIPNLCPNCYTVRDFCHMYNRGAYILGTGSHVIAVIDGDYYDIWDSGDEVPVYYWTSE